MRLVKKAEVPSPFRVPTWAVAISRETCSRPCSVRLGIRTVVAWFGAQPQRAKTRKGRRARRIVGLLQEDG